MEYDNINSLSHSKWRSNGKPAGCLCAGGADAPRTIGYGPLRTAVRESLTFASVEP